MRIQQQNQSFGAVKINRHLTSELLGDTPLVSAYEAASFLENTATQRGDFQTAQDALSFQHSIIKNGNDSVFSKEETDRVYALKNEYNLRPILTYIKGIHEKAKNASFEGFAATMLQKFSYTNSEEITKVVSEFATDK